LAVVKKIADDHRATVTLGANDEGRGAVVTLTFTAARSEEADHG
jgi:nitrogen fixation/metabolism regulation signal transduction histidine kinase